MLHSVMEQHLGGVSLDALVGYTEEGVTLTGELIEEMVKPALAALDALLAEYGVEPDDEYEYELEVRCKFPKVDAFGTVDLIVRWKTYVFVLDWKFGRGVPVSARNNSQLRFYAGAARETPSMKSFFKGAETLVVGIIQPAMDVPYSHEVVEWGELDEFVAEVRAAIGASLAGGHDPNPGKWCRWCRAKPMCPAKVQVADQSLATPTETTDPDELGRLVDVAHELEDWISGVRKAAMHQLESGGKVTGWKLVEGRATRKWSDEGAAEALLRKHGVNEIHEIKLISPAKAEKALKSAAADLEPLIVSRRGTTMAREDDKRPAITNPAGRLDDVPAGISEAWKR